MQHVLPSMQCADFFGEVNLTALVNFPKARYSVDRNIADIAGPLLEVQRRF
jgi:hypothetical protein